jgi:hypothetical protein
MFKLEHPHHLCNCNGNQSQKNITFSESLFIKVNADPYPIIIFVICGYRASPIMQLKPTTLLYGEDANNLANLSFQFTRDDSYPLPNARTPYQSTF